MSFKKKISVAVLGSTGSIGKTSLKILSKYKGKFNVELLACNSNKKVIINQIKKFKPKYVIISDLKVFNKIKKIKFKSKIYFFNCLDKFVKKNKIKYDKTILGISSIGGLKFAFAFVGLSKQILVANKETIVCGGKFFLKLAKKKNCDIVSIDSEHYCLNSILKKNNIDNVSKVYITASGGPFLNKKKSQIKKIDYKHALKHPKWKMGKKISIDSATFANKGLEIIEASYLFNLHPKNIKVKIHKEAKIHCAILLKNGLVYLVAHNTSMEIPIKNSLFDNLFFENKQSFYNNKKNFIFSFDELNLNKFKMLFLAYKALSLGERACIFYNVINDYLVELYLNRKIFFYEIEHKLNKILNNKKLRNFFRKKINNINDINETIAHAKFHIIKN